MGWLFGRKKPPAPPETRPLPPPRQVEGPDGFVHPEGEAGVLHATISSLLQELLANEKLEFAERRVARNRPAWMSLGETGPEAQRRIVLALVDRLQWEREQPRVEGDRDDTVTKRVRAARWALNDLLEDLLRRSHPFTAGEVERILDLCLAQRWYHGPWHAVLHTVEVLARQSGLTPALRERLLQARGAFGRYQDRDHRELLRRVDDLLGDGSASAWIDHGSVPVRSKADPSPRRSSTLRSSSRWSRSW